MTAATTAHEDQVESLLGHLGESDCFIVCAVFALDVSPPRQGWVFYALWVHLEVFGSHRVVRPVHAIVNLVTLFGSLGSCTELALELEIVSLVYDVLSRLQHIVTVITEAHAFEVMASLGHKV